VIAVLDGSDLERALEVPRHILGQRRRQGAVVPGGPEERGDGGGEVGGEVGGALVVGVDVPGLRAWEASKVETERNGARTLYQLSAGPMVVLRKVSR
jgi:hypothetical protein